MLRIHSPNMIMKTKLMTNMADGNRLTNGTGTWFKRMMHLAWTAGAARRRVATCLLCVAVLIPALATLGCSDMMTTAGVPSEASNSKPSGNLAPGDVVNVIFSGAPELNTRQKIQPNGKVSLPTVGDVSASGKTITGLQQQLTSLYQPHLQDPSVVVSLADAAAGVYVSGEVLRPGKIPLDRPMTALEAVMEAGGFTKLANPKQVFIVRNQEGKSQRYVLNMKQALYGNESIPFYVRAYDVIYVKESSW